MSALPVPLPTSSSFVPIAPTSGQLRGASAAAAAAAASLAVGAIGIVLWRRYSRPKPRQLEQCTYLIPHEQLLKLWNNFSEATTHEIDRILYSSPNAYQCLIREYGLKPLAEVQAIPGCRTIAISYLWDNKANENVKALGCILELYKKEYNLNPSDMYYFVDLLSFDQQDNDLNALFWKGNWASQIYMDMELHFLLAGNMSTRLWCYYELFTRLQKHLCALPEDAVNLVELNTAINERKICVALAKNTTIAYAGSFDELGCYRSEDKIRIKAHLASLGVKWRPLHSAMRGIFSQLEGKQHFLSSL